MPPGQWKKSPPDLVERFAGALPAHSGVERHTMFGCPCAFTNGHMFCGLFQDRALVRLGAGAAAELIATGRTPDILYPFRLSRFYERDLVGEKGAASVGH